MVRLFFVEEEEMGIPKGAGLRLSFEEREIGKRSSYPP